LRDGLEPAPIPEGALRPVEKRFFIILLIKFYLLMGQDFRCLLELLGTAGWIGSEDESESSV
jgi:hypothetical protein